MCRANSAGFHCIREKKFYHYIAYSSKRIMYAYDASFHIRCFKKQIVKYRTLHFFKSRCMKSDNLWARTPKNGVLNCFSRADASDITNFIVGSNLGTVWENYFNKSSDIHDHLLKT